MSALPPGWGDDEVTRFIDVARDNTLATFHNLRPEFAGLVRADSAYREIFARRCADGWVGQVFAMRSHAAWLGAVRMAMSGQVVEAYDASGGHTPARRG